MPHFFNLKELTQIQKDNWEKSIKNYTKILELNCLNELNAMTREQKSKFMKNSLKKEFNDEDILSKLLSVALVMGNSPGDEKSALFARLLNGLPILKNPPPLSYSYPDYNIVESNSEMELPHFMGDSLKGLLNNSTKQILNINQFHWKVIEIINDKKAKITNSRWENDGFVWEMEYKEITAKRSISAIISHHNPNINKITTYNELVSESIFQAKEYFDSIKLALDNEEYKKYEEKEKEKYGGFAIGLAQTRLNGGKKLLNDRREKNLQDLPTEEEIEKYALDNLERNYLSRGYFVKNGIIYLNTWVIRRISPTVLTEDSYINLEKLCSV